MASESSRDLVALSVISETFTGANNALARPGRRASHFRSPRPPIDLGKLDPSLPRATLELIG
jgi:hypothetical protein